MLTAGIDIGSRSAQSVIMKDDGIVVYSNIETGPDSVETAYRSIQAALKKAGLALEQLDYILATGYGRVVIPFADENASEITCHARGAHWLFPSVRTILDMGGQDCKAIRCDACGRITRFAMNDKCAGGTGRFFEIISEVLRLPLERIGHLSLESTAKVTFNTRCAVIAKSEAMGLLRKGTEKKDVLGGLHDAVTRRVVSLLHKVTVVPDLVVTGGIAKNAGVVKRLEEKLNVPILLPKDPQLAGALGAALIAAERV
jgi:predicted CoA-substrate-specific enzyme activase